MIPMKHKYHMRFSSVLFLLAVGISAVVAADPPPLNRAAALAADPNAGMDPGKAEQRLKVLEASILDQALNSIPKNCRNYKHGAGPATPADTWPQGLSQSPGMPIANWVQDNSTTWLGKQPDYKAPTSKTDFNNSPFNPVNLAAYSAALLRQGIYFNGTFASGSIVDPKMPAESPAGVLYRCLIAQPELRGTKLDTLIQSIASAPPSVGTPYRSISCGMWPPRTPFYPPVDPSSTGSETPRIPELQPGFATDQQGFTSPTRIDNITSNYLHFADDVPILPDATAATNLSGRIFGNRRIEPAMIRRIHRFRDIGERGSFGPGVFSQYDISCTVTLNGNSAGVRLFDPSYEQAIRLYDGAYGDVRDGRFTGQKTFENPLVVKEFVLTRGAGGADDTPVSALGAAGGAKVVARNGTVFRFEIVQAAFTKGQGTSGSTVVMTREGPVTTWWCTIEQTCTRLEGRLISIENAPGQQLKISYERNWTRAQLEQEPGRIFQMQRVVDAHGRAFSMVYNPELSGGRWSIAKIIVPSGVESHEVAYDYDSLGYLTKVTYADGAESRFTWNFDAIRKSTTLDMRDVTATDGIVQRKVYLSNLFSEEDHGTYSSVYNSSSLLVRALVDADGRAKYANIYDASTWATWLVYEGGGVLKQVGPTAVKWYGDQWTVNTAKTGFSAITGSTRVSGVTNDLGGNWSNYAANQPAGVILRNNQRVALEYTGRVMTSMIYPDGTKDLYQVASPRSDRISRYQSRTNDVIKYTYDADDNLIRVETGLKYSYATGQDEVTQAYSQWAWEYMTAPKSTLRGLLMAYSDPRGDRYEYDYDAKRRLSTLIHRAYDAASDEHKSSESLTYDTSGRLATSTAATGVTATYHYDLRDRITKIDYSDQTTDVITFFAPDSDNPDKVRQRVFRNGSAKESVYDKQGRITSLLMTGVDGAMNDLWTWSYVPGTTAIDTRKGLLNETERFTYDSELSLLGSCRKARDGTERYTTLTYGRGRQLIAMKLPDLRRLFWTYDTNGYLERQVEERAPGALAVPGINALGVFTDIPQSMAYISALARPATPAAGTYLLTEAVSDRVGTLMQIRTDRNEVINANSLPGTPLSPPATQQLGVTLPRWYLPASTTSSGLAARWSFERDLSSSVGGYLGLPIGQAPTLGEGRIGRSVILNGTSSIDLGRVLLNRDGFTLSAWIKLDPSSAIAAALLPGTSSPIALVDASLPQSFRDGFTWQVVDGELRFQVRASGRIWNARSSPTMAWDQWMHVAVVVDRRSGKAELYRDGTRITVDDEIPTVFPLATNLRLGGEADGANFMRGSIDELRVNNDILSQSSIADLVKDAGTVTMQQIGDVLTGRLAHWRFDSGAGIGAHGGIDASGFARDLTIKDKSDEVRGSDFIIPSKPAPLPTITEGPVGKAWMFASGSQVRAPGAGRWLNFLNVASMSFWFRGDLQKPSGLLGSADGSTWSNGCQIYGVGDGSLHAEFQTDGGQIVLQTGNLGLDANKWHHFIVIIDPTGPRLLLDGVEKIKTLWPSGASALGGMRDLVIGRSRGNAGVDHEWVGGLDDLRIFGRSLSDADIAALIATDPVNSQIQERFGIIDLKSAPNVEMTIDPSVAFTAERQIDSSKPNGYADRAFKGDQLYMTWSSIVRPAGYDVVRYPILSNQVVREVICRRPFIFFPAPIVPTSYHLVGSQLELTQLATSEPNLDTPSRVIHNPNYHRYYSVGVGGASYGFENEPATLTTTPLGDLQEVIGVSSEASPTITFNGPTDSGPIGRYITKRLGLYIDNDIKAWRAPTPPILIVNMIGRTWNQSPYHGGHSYFNLQGDMSYMTDYDFDPAPFGGLSVQPGSNPQVKYDNHWRGLRFAANGPYGPKLKLAFAEVHDEDTDGLSDELENKLTQDLVARNLEAAYGTFSPHRANSGPLGDNRPDRERYLTLAKSGVFNSEIDSDHDGLTDREEQALLWNQQSRVDVNNANSDQDYFGPGVNPGDVPNDSLEVSIGSDPSVKNPYRKLPPLTVQATAASDAIQLTWSFASTWLGSDPDRLPVSAIRIENADTGSVLTSLAKDQRWFSVPGLAAATDYRFRVVAVGLAGDEVIAVTPPVRLAPGVVSVFDLVSLTATTDPTHVYLQWRYEPTNSLLKAQKPIGFVVHRQVIGAVGSERLIGVLPVDLGPTPRSVYTFTDNEVDAGISFTYLVSALDEQNRRSPGQALVVTTPQLSAATSGLGWREAIFTSDGLFTDRRDGGNRWTGSGQGSTFAEPYRDAGEPATWSLVVTPPTTPAPVTPVASTAGLRGEYFNGVAFNTKRFERIDAPIDFLWGYGSPWPDRLGNDQWSARWTGRVKPRFSETYTFSTTTDDGARLWVNGVLLIDKWVNQGATAWSGTIALQAGQEYELKLEYYDSSGNASAQLRWQSTSQPAQIIPSSCLLLPSGFTAPTTPVINEPTVAAAPAYLRIPARPLATGAPTQFYQTILADNDQFAVSFGLQILGQSPVQDPGVNVIQFMTSSAENGYGQVTKFIVYPDHVILGNRQAVVVHGAQPHQYTIFKDAADLSLVVDGIRIPLTETTVSEGLEVQPTAVRPFLRFGAVSSNAAVLTQWSNLRSTSGANEWFPAGVSIPYQVVPPATDLTADVTTPGQVTLAWSGAPAPQVLAYRVTLDQLPAWSAIVSNATSSASLVAPLVIPGTYQARIQALDLLGRASVPTQPLTFTVNPLIIGNVASGSFSNHEREWPLVYSTGRYLDLASGSTEWFEVNVQPGPNLFQMAFNKPETVAGTIWSLEADFALPQKEMEDGSWTSSAASLFQFRLSADFTYNGHAYGQFEYWPSGQLVFAVSTSINARYVIKQVPVNLGGMPHRMRVFGLPDSSKGTLREIQLWIDQKLVMTIDNTLYSPLSKGIDRIGLTYDGITSLETAPWYLKRASACFGATGTASMAALTFPAPITAVPEVQIDQARSVFDPVKNTLKLAWSKVSDDVQEIRVSGSSRGSGLGIVRSIPTKKFINGSFQPVTSCTIPADGDPMPVALTAVPIGAQGVTGVGSSFSYLHLPWRQGGTVARLELPNGQPVAPWTFMPTAASSGVHTLTAPSFQMPGVALTIGATPTPINAVPETNAFQRTVGQTWTWSGYVAIDSQFSGTIVRVADNNEKGFAVNFTKGALTVAGVGSTIVTAMPLGVNYIQIPTISLTPDRTHFISLTCDNETINENNQPISIVTLQIDQVPALTINLRLSSRLAPTAQLAFGQVKYPDEVLKPVGVVRVFPQVWTAITTKIGNAAPAFSGFVAEDLSTSGWTWTVQGVGASNAPRALAEPGRGIIYLAPGTSLAYQAALAPTWSMQFDATSTGNGQSRFAVSSRLPDGNLVVTEVALRSGAATYRIVRTPTASVLFVNGVRASNQISTRRADSGAISGRIAWSVDSAATVDLVGERLLIPTAIDADDAALKPIGEPVRYLAFGVADAQGFADPKQNGYLFLHGALAGSDRPLSWHFDVRNPVSQSLASPQRVDVGLAEQVMQVYTRPGNYGVTALRRVANITTSLGSVVVNPTVPAPSTVIVAAPIGLTVDAKADALVLTWLAAGPTDDVLVRLNDPLSGPVAGAERVVRFDQLPCTIAVPVNARGRDLKLALSARRTIDNHQWISKPLEATVSTLDMHSVDLAAGLPALSVAAGDRFASVAVSRHPADTAGYILWRNQSSATTAADSVPVRIAARLDRDTVQRLRLLQQRDLGRVAGSQQSAIRALLPASLMSYTRPGSMPLFFYHADRPGVPMPVPGVTNAPDAAHPALLTLDPWDDGLPVFSTAAPVPNLGSQEDGVNQLPATAVNTVTVEMPTANSPPEIISANLTLTTEGGLRNGTVVKKISEILTDPLKPIPAWIVNNVDTTPWLVSATTKVDSFRVSGPRVGDRALTRAELVLHNDVTLGLVQREHVTGTEDDPSVLIAPFIYDEQRHFITAPVTAVINGATSFKRGFNGLTLNAADADGATTSSLLGTILVDDQAPLVSLRSPIANSLVTRPFSIAGTYVEDSGISNLRVWVRAANGSFGPAISLNAERASVQNGFFAIRLNKEQVPLGNIVIQVVMTDLAGNDSAATQIALTTSDDGISCQATLTMRSGKLDAVIQVQGAQKNAVDKPVLTELTFNGTVIPPGTWTGGTSAVPVIQATLPAFMNDQTTVAVGTATVRFPVLGGATLSRTFTFAATYEGSEAPPQLLSVVPDPLTPVTPNNAGDLEFTSFSLRYIDTNPGVKPAKIRIQVPSLTGLLDVTGKFTRDATSSDLIAKQVVTIPASDPRILIHLEDGSGNASDLVLHYIPLTIAQAAQPLILATKPLILANGIPQEVDLYGRHLDKLESLDLIAKAAGVSAVSGMVVLSRSPSAIIPGTAISAEHLHVRVAPLAAGLAVPRIGTSEFPAAGVLVIDVADLDERNRFLARVSDTTHDGRYTIDDLDTNSDGVPDAPVLPKLPVDGKPGEIHVNAANPLSDARAAFGDDDSTVPVVITSPLNLKNAVGIHRIAVSVCHVIRSTHSAAPPIW
jgi:YD repeat-containing protein